MYIKCIEVEEAEGDDVILLKVRRVLEYMVHDLGEKNQELFQNIEELGSNNILDANTSRIFHELRCISNKGIHGDIKINNKKRNNYLDKLMLLTIWYGIQKGKKYEPNQFTSHKIKNYLVSIEKFSAKVNLNNEKSHSNVEEKKDTAEVKQKKHASKKIRSKGRSIMKKWAN